MPLEVEAWSPNHWTAREVPCLFLNTSTQGESLSTQTIHCISRQSSTREAAPNHHHHLSPPAPSFPVNDGNGDGKQESKQVGRDAQLSCSGAELVTLGTPTPTDTWTRCWMDWKAQEKEKSHLIELSYLETWETILYKNEHGGASLVAQWLRIHLPMQGTRVRALVREDPTCRGATKPVHHNYRACALEPVCHNYWSPRA